MLISHVTVTQQEIQFYESQMVRVDRVVSNCFEIYTTFFSFWSHTLKNEIFVHVRCMKSFFFVFNQRQKVSGLTTSSKSLWQYSHWKDFQILKNRRFIFKFWKVIALFLNSEKSSLYFQILKSRRFILKFWKIVASSLNSRKSTL